MRQMINGKICHPEGYIDFRPGKVGKSGNGLLGKLLPSLPWQFLISPKNSTIFCIVIAFARVYHFLTWQTWQSRQKMWILSLERS
jgi:hypothetical protein